jgi:hypothetical protein
MWHNSLSSDLELGARMLNHIRISAGGRPREVTEIEVHLKHGPSAIVALTAPVSLTSKPNNLNFVTLIHYFQINTVLRESTQKRRLPATSPGFCTIPWQEYRNWFYLSHGYHFFHPIVDHKEMRLENLGSFSVIADVSRSSIDWLLRPAPASTPLFKLPSIVFPSKVGLVIRSRYQWGAVHGSNCYLLAGNSSSIVLARQLASTARSRYKKVKLPQIKAPASHPVLFCAVVEPAALEFGGSDSLSGPYFQAVNPSSPPQACPQFRTPM